MTDTSGFPPFRSARPKGQEPVVTNTPRAGETEEQTRARSRTERPAPVQREMEIAEAYEERSAKANAEVEQMLDPILHQDGIRRITVCAKCGSREVREAVLIGDEVYVKL